VTHTNIIAETRNGSTSTFGCVALVLQGAQAEVYEGASRGVSVGDQTN
jgi:hypothetical protein